MVLQSHETNQNLYYQSPFSLPRDKLKPLYLHYHSAYGHETW